MKGLCQNQLGCVGSGGCGWDRPCGAGAGKEEVGRGVDAMSLA